MTLKEVGIVIGKKLEVERGGGMGPPTLFIVAFADTKVMVYPDLCDAYSCGDTLIKAKRNYCSRIRGRLLVIDEGLRTKKEVQLPKTITV